MPQTLAEKLAGAPDQEVQDALDEAQDQSAKSDSLYANYFRQEDGSTAIVTSWRGSEPLLRAFTSDEQIPQDLAYDHIPEEAQAGLEAAEAEAAARAESAAEPDAEADGD